MSIENENEFDAAINKAIRVEVHDDNTVPKPGAKAQRRKVRNIVVGSLVLAAVGAAAFVGSRFHETTDSE